MDWVQWVVRAVIIIVAVILAVVIWRGRKEGRFQEYSLRFFVIGITAFILGAVLLIVSATTDLSFGYEVFLTAVGAVVVFIGLIIRFIWERNR